MGDVHTADAFDVLKQIDESSFHAAVTDPPYGLEFMGKEWDKLDGEGWRTGGDFTSPGIGERKNDWPSFGSSGTANPTCANCGGRERGSNKCDCKEPKWRVKGKPIDVALREQRIGQARKQMLWHLQWAELVYPILKPGGHLLAFGGSRTHHHLMTGIEYGGFEIRDTITWHYGSGFPKNSSTQLKPATEFILLARKPFNNTVDKNVQSHGTGKLNVDGCRIDGGRHPANVMFDAGEAKRLDSKVGSLSAGHHTGEETKGYGETREYDGPGLYTDTGGPSRYFYTSKASQSERTLDGRIENAHPTVKPVDLMEWLIRLVTVEGQHIIDPFAGSGTTGRAAKNIGREFTLIERDEHWADVARARCGLTPENPELLTDEQQATLSI